jgi:hypothetical protein
VTIPVNVDAIHSMILDNRRISTKEIAETIWSSNWSPKVETSFRKESCFFKTILLLTRRPLRTRN